MGTFVLPAGSNTLLTYLLPPLCAAVVGRQVLFHSGITVGRPNAGRSVHRGSWPLQLFYPMESARADFDLRSIHPQTQCGSRLMKERAWIAA